MKVLVIAPHMDDEVLGMGATIAKHVDQGDIVHVVIVANRIYNHTYDSSVYEKERACTENAQKVLGYQELKFLNLPDERLDQCIQDILIPLEAHYEEIAPDTLYVNFRGDNNQDHRAVFDAVRIISRSAANHRLNRFLMYEVPSATDQSPPLFESAFMPNLYVNIEDQLDKKIEAFHFYVTERRPFPHPRSEEAIRVLARKRGIESGNRAAEAFVVLRDLWD